MESLELTPVMKTIKPTLDELMKAYENVSLTDEIRKQIASRLDETLVNSGYKDRLVRLSQPEPDGDTAILIFTRDVENKKKNEFTVTTVTIRGAVTPEELN